MHLHRLSVAIGIALALLLVVAVSSGPASEPKEDENASNPLAAVNNTDFRYQYFDLDGPERNEFFLDGAYMVIPKIGAYADGLVGIGGDKPYEWGVGLGLRFMY